MLALFIVLWILSQDQPTKEAIAGYFRDPIGFAESMGAAQLSVVPGNAPPTTTAAVMDQLEKSLSVEVSKLQNSVQANAELSELGDQIQIELTEEGIRIELRDNVKFNFFESGSSSVTPQLRKLLQLLTPEIQALGYPVAIEGHTDSKKFGGPGFTNFELSAERANSVRRAMTEYGLIKYAVATNHGIRRHETN